MIKYGLISETDARTLEKTIDLICQQFPGQEINITEIGVYNGETSRGLFEYTTNKYYGSASMPPKVSMESSAFKCKYTAIDNEKDKPILKPFPECNLIIGNSNEVYNPIEDDSQHLIFIDGCHCFAHVISDFFCYAPKVKQGGYLAFHDTGKHIKEFKDFQHGDEKNPDAYISVRKALNAVGMIEDYHNGWGCTMGFYDLSTPDWELIFDEADTENEAGGIIVFNKYY